MSRSTREAQVPSLGSTIRAARLGYRWMPRLMAFVRIADLGPEHFRVDIAPDREIRPHRCPFRVWWEGDIATAAEVIEIAERVLAGGTRVRRVKRAVAFEMADDGSFVGWLP